MLMNADASHLMIIDVQSRLLPVIASPEQVAARCNILLAAANELDIPVTVTEQYPNGLGHTDQAIALAGTEKVLEKTTFSCLRDAAMAERLEQLGAEGRRQIIIGGIEAHVCVLQTALDLIQAGFEVFVAADAVSSRKTSSVELAMARLRDEGGSIVNSEMVLFEWLKQAGTPVFKRLSGLIK